ALEQCSGAQRGGSSHLTWRLPGGVKFATANLSSVVEPTVLRISLGEPSRKNAPAISSDWAARYGPASTLPSQSRWRAWLSSASTAMKLWPYGATTVRPTESGEGALIGCSSTVPSREMGTSGPCSQRLAAWDTSRKMQRH